MNFRGFTARFFVIAAVLGAWTTGAAAQDDKVFKLGLVAFLSGPAAKSFGKPLSDGAKTVIDALNASSEIPALRQSRFWRLEN